MTSTTAKLLGEYLRMSIRNLSKYVFGVFVIGKWSFHFKI
ncbi:Protein CBG25988 [Caenorhabditis briggsae]|uniref:Protein CBG25988 n=1 Tax=Caenorhabditis briggsae TaxID=6238 RepID=B6IKT8_CAEBR|nr:Protein CBG25988 [Caenorhabditis briggsae]CAS00518.1 Protein CBG25988 [Caenorhabditis briggsae]